MYFNVEAESLKFLFGTESQNDSSYSNRSQDKNIVERYTPLIEKCLIGKPRNLVSEKELKALGVLALLSFDKESFKKLNFPSLALNRIDKFMNKAIAEAIFIKNMSNQSAKSDVCAEFTSIDKRFS
jgi:hypothetical protein